MADYLQANLGRRYIATLEERVFIEGADRASFHDVWVREGQPDASRGSPTAAEADVPLLVEAPMLFIFELYPRKLQERLPRIAVPLAGSDPDVTLDIQAMVSQVNDAGSYRHRLKYDAPCVPPLSAENQEWANQLIRQAPSTTNGS